MTFILSLFIRPPFYSLDSGNGIPEEKYTWDFTWVHPHCSGMRT